MTKILLARHGESDWNAAQRWQGHADRPLTKRGRHQAFELGKSLTGISLDAVYASDLRRAWETAELAVEGRGLAVTRLAELREVDVGSWSGLSRTELVEQFPEGVRRWKEGKLGWEDGEAYEAMGARVVEAVRRIAEDHSGATVLVVSHGGPIRAVKAHALGLDFHTYRVTNPVEEHVVLSAVSVENGRIAPCALH